MKTGIVKRLSRSPRSQGEFEDASPQSSMRNQGSTSALVAMIVCDVILLLMLSACSPPAHAQVLALQASGAIAAPGARGADTPSQWSRP